MTSVVRVERVVDCPFSFAIDEAKLIFPLLEVPAGGVRLPYRVGPLRLRRGALARPVTVRFRRQRDVTEPGRSHDEIAFDWDAQSRWLPNFHGVLRFRIEFSQTRVILQGAYVPPFGGFGALFDRIIGHDLAVTSGDDLVRRLARGLEAGWATEKLALL